MQGLKQNSAEIIGIFLLISASAGLIYVRAKVDPGIEQLIIEVLLLGLSSVAGFLVQKIASKQDLKGYGKMAFRRIADINKSINRVLKEVRTVRSDEELTKISIGKVEAIMIGVSDTAISSMYDWTEILASEIELLNRINKLEQERNEIGTSEERLAEIRTELDRLKQELPFEFKGLSADFSGEIFKYEDWRGEYPPPEKDIFDLFRLMEQLTQQHGGLHLVVSLYPGAEAKRTNLSQPDYPFYIGHEAGAGSLWLSIRDNDDVIGEIDKDTNDFGTDYRRYFIALARFLQIKGMVLETSLGMNLINARFENWHPVYPNKFILFVPENRHQIED